jgi:hypothetical protein
MRTHIGWTVKTTLTGDGRRDERLTDRQTFFSTSMGDQIPTIPEKPITTSGCRANEIGPVPLVQDLRIVHDRFGSSSDPSLNGNLHYPNNIDRSLNETADDKIRKYRADYNNNPPNTVSFIPAIASTSGRLQNELVRLLFLQDHRETDRVFYNLRSSACAIWPWPVPLPPLVSIFRCSSSPINPVYPRHVTSNFNSYVQEHIYWSDSTVSCKVNFDFFVTSPMCGNIHQQEYFIFKNWNWPLFCSFRSSARGTWPFPVPLPERDVLLTSQIKMW